MTQTSEEAIAQGSPYIVLNGKYLGRQLGPHTELQEFSLVQQGAEILGFDPEIAPLLNFISKPRSTDEFSDWVIDILNSDPTEIANALWEVDLLLMLGGHKSLDEAARDLDEITFVPSISSIDPVDQFGFEWRVKSLEPTASGDPNGVPIRRDLLLVVQGDGTESIYACAAKAAAALSIPVFMVVAVILDEIPLLVSAACGSLLKLG